MNDIRNQDMKMYLNAFFGGVSKFNDSLVGWAGHTDNKSTFESVTGTKKHKWN